MASKVPVPSHRERLPSRLIRRWVGHKQSAFGCRHIKAGSQQWHVLMDLMTLGPRNQTRHSPMGWNRRSSHTNAVGCDC